MCVRHPPLIYHTSRYIKKYAADFWGPICFRANTIDYLIERNSILKSA